MCYTILPFINTLVAICGISIGLYQYSKQRSFNRIKNLSSIWENFTNKDEISKLFMMLNDLELEENESSNENIKKDVEGYSKESKFKFLAMLEEVVVYSKLGQVDLEYALEYFQWHFYYIYISSKTSDAFWKNIGGANERDDTASWKRQRNFAEMAKALISPVPA